MRNPRSFLASGPNVKEYHNQYSICVYTGTEGDVFHRIIENRDGFRMVGLSSKNIQMEPKLDVEQFFNYDPYWVTLDAWIERQKALEHRKKQYERMALQNLMFSYRQIPRRRWRF